ncbi:MAG: hypothetical protein U9Q22_04270 [Candidatus Altiarchaeota archaeon]|nr:hypothetical protein [Candidatus Altiarchaeota archaeon]
MANIICFDLEGPLSPQDNAYEVMGLVREGHKLFEVISRYDDILTLEGRMNYEPGDTLSLIIPFLIHHEIREGDIRKISDKAKIVDGVDYVIDRLKELDWDTYIISTSYEQHALNVARRIGLPREKVYCTRFSLDQYRGEITEEDVSLIEDVERDILELYPPSDDKEIKNRLDKFFREDLLKTNLGDIMKEVKVVGGQRKVDALYDIAGKTGKTLGDMIVVGDSITDYKMLGEVKSRGGVSIVFNGNEYALPHANVGLASTDMRFLLPIIAAYANEGRDGVLDVVKEWEKRHDELMKTPQDIPKELIPDDVKRFLMEKVCDESFFKPYFHYLGDVDEGGEKEVLEIHKRARSRVRGEAAKLG